MLAVLLLLPRGGPARRLTFIYGLGEEFIQVLKTLKLLGLDRTDPVSVKGVQVAPRDVVAALLPDPAHLGPRMVGKTCAGTWVKGEKDGKPRQVYLYQVADNQECMERYGCQAVVAQTGVNAVIGLELLAEGIWQWSGVLPPEAFDPLPFLERLAGYAFSYAEREMDPDGR